MFEKAPDAVLELRMSPASLTKQDSAPEEASEIRDKKVTTLHPVTVDVDPLESLGLNKEVKGSEGYIVHRVESD